MREGPPSGLRRRLPAGRRRFHRPTACDLPLRASLHPIGSIGAGLTLAEPFLRIAAEMANQSLELFGRSREPLPVGAAQHQGHAEIAAAEVWVGADLDI